MAVMKEFSLGHQNSTVNMRHKMGNYAIVDSRGPIPLEIVWPSAAPITYGDSLSDSALVGGSATTLWGYSVAGVFQWADGSTVYGSGIESPGVVFIPESHRFESTEGTVDVTVNQRALEVTAQAAGKTYSSPSTADPVFGYDITSGSLYGTDEFTGSLSREDADNHNAGVYSITMGTLTAGPNYQINLTPANLTILQATPIVSTWPTASDIDRGQLLSVSNLSGGSVSVAGSFSWNNPIDAPEHRQNHQVWFTPNDSNYQSVSGSVEVTPWQYYVQPEQVIVGSGSGSYGLVGRYLDTNETYIIMRNKWFTGANEWQKVSPIQSVSGSWTGGFYFPTPTAGRIITHVGAIVEDLWPSYWFYARGAFSGSVEGTGAGGTLMNEQRVGYSGGGEVELRQTRGVNRNAVVSIWERNYLSTTNPAFNINSLNLIILNDEWVQRHNLLVSNQVNSFTYSQSGYSDTTGGSSGEFYLRVKYKYHTIG